MYRLKILLQLSHIGFVELATNSSLMLMEWHRISQTSYVASILMLAALLAALLQLLVVKGLGAQSCVAQYTSYLAK